MHLQHTKWTPSSPSSMMIDGITWKKGTGCHVYLHLAWWCRFLFKIGGLLERELKNLVFMEIRWKEYNLHQCKQLMMKLFKTLKLISYLSPLIWMKCKNDRCKGKVHGVVKRKILKKNDFTDVPFGPGNAKLTNELYINQSETQIKCI